MDIYSALTKPRLSEEDFTKQGEAIPKDAGLTDFIRYNIARFGSNPEDLAAMGMASGGIKNIAGRVLPSLYRGLQEIPESYPKPDFSNPGLAKTNLDRPYNPNTGGTPGVVPKRGTDQWYEADTLLKHLEENAGGDDGVSSRIKFK